MIEFKDFTFTYPTGRPAPALRSITLTVRPGTICGVVGADGSGKTTLAAVVSGVSPHLTGGEFSGSVEVCGRPVAGTPMAELATSVGLVRQDPFSQISGARFSVREELAFGLENLAVERDVMRHRVEQVMEDVGLSELADRSPYELSGGQQQRLAIGSVLAMRPAMIVLDEPTSQLDAEGSRRVFDILDALKERGVAVLVMEHRLELLARSADQVVVLEDGAVVADGPTREVLGDPRLPEWGVGPLQYTTAARRAAEHGLWDESRPLPVTLETAADGFHQVTHRIPIPAGDQP
ncbi:energy-coupling factor ABC transporter ATP-binding protein [Streptomyces cacaoi]|uniref:energy-coupling factor ABC transporter ATP-binding protein n=1 Tax=Streptomyces cacaoi TaxID=1898 RepID=UPI0011F384E1|nr:ABC transporter ATP-binding protein [Streptomyces cacaoi]